jgi:hypothetical protein
VPWQLDFVCFGEWEVVVTLGTVTRLRDAQSGKHSAVHCEDTRFLSSSKCTYTASYLTHIKSSLCEGKVAGM